MELTLVNFIKLTLDNDNKSIYVNPKTIGFMYKKRKEMNLEYTHISNTTHNNGGFKVKETPEEIIKMCKLIFGE